MQKFGSTKILAALIAAIHLTNKIDGSLEDQKITALEWGQIGLAGFQFAWSLVNIKQLKEEYLDLDAAEKEELIAAFAAELDIRNDKAEALVEKIFSVLIQLSGILKIAA